MPESNTYLCDECQAFFIVTYIRDGEDEDEEVDRHVEPLLASVNFCPRCGNEID